jgi:hypothetical protein
MVNPVEATAAFGIDDDRITHVNEGHVPRRSGIQASTLHLPRDGVWNRWGYQRGDGEPELSHTGPAAHGE